MLEKISSDHPSEGYKTDEFRLQFRLAPSTNIAAEQLSGSKNDKACITCLGCRNATGSDKVPFVSLERLAIPMPLEGIVAKSLVLTTGLTPMLELPLFFS